MKTKIGDAVVRLIECLRARLRLVIWSGVALLALLVLFDAILVNKEDAHTNAEHWPAFWSVFGFVACLLIIFVSKWYGHRGIMTREDYYER